MAGMQTGATPAADVGTVMMGVAGASVVAVMAIISAIGSINGTMMTSTRVYYAMAREGLFFGWLDHLHPRFRTPSRSIAIYCGWTAVILLVRQQFSTIVTGVVFAILIFSYLGWDRVGYVAEEMIEPRRTLAALPDPEPGRR